MDLVELSEKCQKFAPEKPRLVVPNILMKISKDIDARNPATKYLQH